MDSRCFQLCIKSMRLFCDPECVCAKSLQSCPTLCDPMDCSPPGPSAHGFSRQKYWSGLPCPSPGNLPNPGIKPTCLKSPAVEGRFFTTSATWEANQGHRKEVILRWPPSSCLLDNLVIYGEENLRRKESWVTNKITHTLYEEHLKLFLTYNVLSTGATERKCLYYLIIQAH